MAAFIRADLVTGFREVGDRLVVADLFVSKRTDGCPRKGVAFFVISFSPVQYGHPAHCLAWPASHSNSILSGLAKAMQVALLSL